MKIQRRNRYIQHLYACLHTLAGRCVSIDELKAGYEPIVKSCSKKKERGKDSYVYYLQMNPNKAVNDEDMIHSYSEFEEVMFDALTSIDAVGLVITRADLSFNSDDSDDYELFKKLNRLLICCIADACNVKNCYKASDLWTDRSLSVAIKSDRLEAENYNKELENPNVKAKCRLELRSKRITGTLKEEFMEKWFTRLDAALDHFEAVQDRYNDNLLMLWQEDQSKLKKDRQYLSLTAFLMRYSDCIYTRRQLINLLTAIGVNKPESTAKHFKEKHTMEFFSKTDLKVIVEGIKKATRKYFNS